MGEDRVQPCAPGRSFIAGGDYCRPTRVGVLAVQSDHQRNPGLLRGDNLAASPTVSRRYLDDRPGAKPATVSLPGGGAIHVMRVAVRGPLIPPRLFVRCDGEGQIFVAIDRTMAPAGSADI